MKFSDQQYAQALYEAINETEPKEHNAIIEKFISILNRNNHLNRYESIIQAYEVYDSKTRGITNATVTVARDTKVSGEIIETLNTLAQSNVAIKTEIDEGIVGGMVIRLDDTLIDASIRGKLNQLKKDLSANQPINV